MWDKSPRTPPTPQRGGAGQCPLHSEWRALCVSTRQYHAPHPPPNRTGGGGAGQGSASGNHCTSQHRAVPTSCGYHRPPAPPKGRMGGAGWGSLPAPAQGSTDIKWISPHLASPRPHPGEELDVEDPDAHAADRAAEGEGSSRPISSTRHRRTCDMHQKLHNRMSH